MKSNPNFQILKRKPHKANHKGKLTKFQTVPAHSDFAKSFPHSHAHHYTHTHTQYNTNLIINIVVSESTDLIHNAIYIIVNDTIIRSGCSIVQISNHIFIVKLGRNNQVLQNLESLSGQV